MKNRTALIARAPPSLSVATRARATQRFLSLCPRPSLSLFSRPSLLALVPQRRALERLGEEHLLGEDQVCAVVVGELVVVAHRDRVERAGDLAVAAEDAAREVDLIHRGVALAGGDAILQSVLRGDHADAVRRAGGRAERAADALLEARVLEAVELVPSTKAWVDGGLLL